MTIKPILSERAARVEPSATFEITMAARALRAAGADVIEMSAGESDFDTPDRIKAAAAQAMERGETRYTPVDGVGPLKEAVAHKFRTENGLSYDAREITIANGAKQVILNALASILEDGAEAIIPAPYWPSYPEMVKFAGGVPRIARPAGGAGDDRIGPADILEASSARTRCVILNVPANPTGCCLDEAELLGLAEALARIPSAWVIVDAIYERFTYGEAPFRTLLQVAPQLRPRTLLVGGLSKSHAMTGWRIGFGAGPAPLIRAMAAMQSQTTSNPCSIAQWAAVEALTGPQDFIAERVAIYRRRRDLLVGGLRTIPGLRCPRPEGAFYVFCDIKAHLGGRTARGTLLGSDRIFARALLDEAGVAVVPGSEFGAPGFLRISFTIAEDRLVAATMRIRAFIDALRRPTSVAQKSQSLSEL